MWSKAFLEELSKTPWKNSFRFECVDPSPTRKPLPGWLKKVPTIVISGESQPRTDGEVMNWISEMKLKNGVAKPTGPSSDEPEAWSLSEHQSFAKGFGYSFQDSDTLTGGNGGTTIPGAFSFLNGSSAPGDRTGQQYPSIADTAKKSKKESMFDNAMEDYKRQRDSGMPQAKPRL